MPDMKKELEREEIHRAIWAIADDLRGSVDGWDFKAYVLCMMFYRFISENLSGYIEAEEIEAGNAGFRYAELSDEDAEEAREDMINVKGFFILPSELFESVLKTASEHVGEGTANDLNMIVERVLNHIEESAQGHISEGEFKGLFDDFDVNSNKLGSTVTKRNERLYRLMQGIANMRLGDYKLSTVDGFGDAYEYLMTMYASNAGKSGGEFFTPPEVSDLLTFLSVDGKTEVNKVYEIFYPWKEQECPVTAKGFVQPYADSPMDEENVGEHVYQHILNNAKKYVYINTPYLIVDDSMLSALRLAAKSGVDIRIITPHRWDKWWVHMTTRSYYRELIKSGVKIYEYTNGFIHSKTFVSDDRTATVGTTNLDFRSLYLHYECGALLYEAKAVMEVKEDFLQTLEICQQVTEKDCKTNIVVHLLQDILRLFAPLM